MFKPMYKASRLVIGNPESNVGIVSLWTKTKKIAEKIDPSKYAVIGNLFSAERGLDLLVRNLLANPGITNIVITGTDFSKSGVVLRDFFEKGFEEGKTEVTGKEVWRVKSEYPGYIGKDIPREALEELRESVNVVWVEDIEGFDFDSLKRPEKKRERRVFEKPEEDVKTYVGEDEVYVVRHEKVVGAWLQILDTILKFGKKTDTHYDDYQKEILNLVSVITDEDPYNLEIPEFLPCDRKHVEEYIPKVTTDFREEGTSYTYGSRMRSWFGTDQVKGAVEKLLREQNSRAVVINLWDSTKDLTIGGSPCINHIWLRIRNGKLYMTVTIRSNDMFEAYPENAFGLRSLQEVIRKEIVKGLEEKGEKSDISLGSLVINSQSAHIYDDCFESARDIVSRYYDRYVKKPSMQLDPRGNFVISAGGGIITAEHTSPSGERLGTYQEHTALAMRDVLVREGVVGTPAHGIYLGTELMKAELAVSHGLEYEQDSPLKIEAGEISSQDKAKIGEVQKLPTHGRLVSVKKIEKTKETVLTYIVNDMEFPHKAETRKEEEKFREFLRGRGLCRVF